MLIFHINFLRWMLIPRLGCKMKQIGIIFKTKKGNKYVVESEVNIVVQIQMKLIHA